MYVKKTIFSVNMQLLTSSHFYAVHVLNSDKYMNLVFHLKE